MNMGKVMARGGGASSRNGGLDESMTGNELDGFVGCYLFGMERLYKATNFCYTEFGLSRICSIWLVIIDKYYINLRNLLFLQTVVIIILNLCD